MKERESVRRTEGEKMKDGEKRLREEGEETLWE